MTSDDNLVSHWKDLAARCDSLLTETYDSVTYTDSLFTDEKNLVTDRDDYLTHGKDFIICGNACPVMGLIYWFRYFHTCYTSSYLNVFQYLYILHT